MKPLHHIPTWRVAALVAALASASLLSPLNAAEPAYLELNAEAQGDIKGDVTLPGREDMIEIYAFSHQIVSPRDAASGLPTGKRQHKPLSIVKRIDKSSPLLTNVLVNNENITEFSLTFWRRNPATGKDEPYYTIRLQNAQVVSIRPWMPNTNDPATRAIPPSEEISFVYQKIFWTWEDGGISAEDDWETPVVAQPAPTE